MAMMDDALALAQSICWDEGYGYRISGHAASHADGVDCGGLVFHCLHAAGYNVADTSPGVSNMPSILTNIGFVGTQYSGNVSDLQHGDIITMVHWEGSEVTDGHTCFIARNVNAYADYTANSDYQEVVDICKVEASWHHDHTAQGDHRKNGTGAYYEVWCHKFYQVYDPDKYDPSDVYVWRDPNYTPGESDEQNFFAALAACLFFPFLIMTKGLSKRRLR